MKNKLFILLVYSMMLSGCFMPVVLGFGDPDIYNDYKVIQGFQKKDTIGHTDVEQRKQDLIDCGVKKFFGGTLDLNTRYPGMNTEQVTQRMSRIYACMEAKRYTFTPSVFCTEDGVSLGICN